MIKYSATYIKPDTAVDGDGEAVPEGWWIEGWSGANDECPDVWVHIEQSVDSDGGDTAQATAERIAELLNADEAAKATR